MDSAARHQSTVGCECQIFLSTVQKVTTDVSSFVRRCHSARADLAPVIREMSKLQMIVQLLSDSDGVIPEELQAHLGPIIGNCTAVVFQVHEILGRHEVAGWTVEARDEAAELAKLLVAHRDITALTSNLMGIMVSRGVQEVRSVEEEQFQISLLVDELQAVASSLVIGYNQASLARETSALQVHLGDIIASIKALAQTDLWQDAVKILDEAQVRASLDSQAPHVRDSVPMPAPLSRGHAADRQAAAAGERAAEPGSGLPPGDPTQRAPSLLPSTLCAPDGAPDPRPPAAAAGAGPSGTGFIVMDGFTNSGAQPAAPSPPVPHDDERQRRHSRRPSEPRSEPPSSRRSFESQDAAERSITRPSAVDPQLLPEAVWAGGAHVARRHAQDAVEKELVVEDPVSDEALAFAHVPIHVLDRLSVNLVGHVYGTSPTSSGGCDRSSSTTGSWQDDKDWNNSVASSRSSTNSGGLGDGMVPLPQIVVSKPPRAHTSAPSARNLSSHRRSPPSAGAHNGLRGVDSVSTMTTVDPQADVWLKPLPRTPLVFIPDYPGPFTKKKVVVVGNMSCGKTSLITRMARGQWPKGKDDELRITETIRLSVDDAPVELCFWDVRGSDYDPSWLRNAHVALVCFSVNTGSTDHKGKQLGQWATEINRNCPGAVVLLVGLKADTRAHAKSAEKLARTGKAPVTPEQGERLRGSIGAQRYLECSARSGAGVQDVLREAARAALQAPPAPPRPRACKRRSLSRSRPLSRIGKFFGFSGQE